MSVQYKTNVLWDKTLASLMLVEDTPTTREAKIAGLVQSAVKITSGAPTATAGKFMPSALVWNAIDGNLYKNSGSSASPVFTVIETAVSAPFTTKFAGTASGGTTATRAYTITGALASDVATAVIRASTNAATVEKATLSANTLTVLFSTDPGAGTTVDYTVTRAS